MFYRSLFLILSLLLTSHVVLTKASGSPSMRFSASEVFLVNDETTGGCDQTFPVVASDGNGGFIMAWADERNGKNGNWGGSYYYRGIDVYCQRFDADGNPVGTNQKVNDSAGNLTRDTKHPISVAMNRNGQFVVVWEDVRGNSDLKRNIFFQLFDAQGNALGSNRQANEDNGTDREGFLAVVMDEQGGFVVTWQKTSETYSEPAILFRQFDAEGNPLGGNQEADDGAERNWTSMDCPSIAMDDAGRFAIAWIGWIEGVWVPGVWVRRFDASAEPLGSAQTANDTTIWAGPYLPSLAMNGRGDFVVAWLDARNNFGDDVDYYDVYFQRYDSSGAALGADVMANDDVTDAGQLHPSVIMGDDGNVTIAWQDNRNDNQEDVYFQRYDADGTPLGTNTQIIADAGAANQTSPNLVLDDDGGFTVVWEDDRGGVQNQDVYFQQFEADGQPRDICGKANDDSGSTDQTTPAVAVAGDGSFIVAWTDERNASDDSYLIYDVYFQQYDADGDPIGVNRKANDGASRIMEPTPPAVAADSSGNFVIVWTDNRVHSRDIYAQRYDASGQPLGLNELINDDGNYDADQSNPAVAMNFSEDYVIVWADYQAWNFGIRFQMFDSDGHRIGASQEPDRSSLGLLPAVGIDDAGRFAVAWWTDAYYDINGDVTIISDVYVQRFDAGGNALGTAQKANDVAEGKRGGPAIAMNGFGEFVVAWQDGRNDAEDVYCQCYDSDGNPLGSNQKANDDTGIAESYSPAVVIDGTGQFVVAWSDERNEAGSAMLTGQGFDSDGNRKGDNFFVTGGLCERFPVAASNAEKILFAWQDNRRQKGFDIYARELSWDEASAVSENRNLPSNCALLPNYPNPFNPETVIPYSLSAAGRVKINIVNVAGQLVRNLIDAEQAVGSHQVCWDGTDGRGNSVQSGIYFCRMYVECDGKVYDTTRKLCLMR